MSREIDRGLVIGTVSLIAAIISVAILWHPPTSPQIKNRVPDLGVVTIHADDLANLQQQVKDTQAAAQAAKDSQAKAEQAQKDIQSQLEQLSKDAKKDEAPEEPKESRAETTRLGAISDFGVWRIEVNTQQTDDYYLGFTFHDREGFIKRFYPVCPEQSVKSDVPVVMMYHWRKWQENSLGKRGCFMIDGFQTQP